MSLKKPGDFLGKEALMERKAADTGARRLVQVLVKVPEPMMYHAEIVHRNGQPIGDVRSASYGHTLGGAVGLAMIESTAIYCFVVTLILIFANAFWNDALARAGG